MAECAPDTARRAHLQAEVLSESQQPLGGFSGRIQPPVPVNPGKRRVLSGIQRVEQLIELRMGLSIPIGEAVLAAAVEGSGMEQMRRGGHRQGSAAGEGSSRLMARGCNAGLLHNICG